MMQESFGSTFKRGYQNLPQVIRVILTVNVVVFLIQAIGGNGLNRLLINLFAFDPQWETALTQPWRLVTYMFLHGSGFHLLFNMLWLWWMGRPVEQHVGPRTFTVLYFGAGIGGALLNVGLAAIIGYSQVIGASGAVFGVMVAFAVLFPRTPIMLFLFPPLEARYVVAGLILFDLLFIGSSDNIARVVHLGGAGIGYLLIQAHMSGTDLSSWVRPVERLWSKPDRRSAGRSRAANRRADMRIVRDVKIMEENELDDLDEILDKISKKGYSALTAEEKRRLFELSKRK
ncbi:MAG: rhomboid family intramembrane serine protease [Balneolaceae bacterium]